MNYSYRCEDHDIFFVTRSINAPSTATEPCPVCSRDSPRDFRADLAPVIYNGQGFHNTDYWPKNPGRGQSADRKEWLNSNWSRYTGDKPPPPDSKGTYDGT